MIYIMAYGSIQNWSLMSIKAQSLQKRSFEDTKGVIRICKLKDRQHNGQTTIYKTLHKKTKDKVTWTPL